MRIKKALLSVSDKTQLVELAKDLVSKGVELIASGGTRKALEEAGIEATSVECITKNPEAFDGRMKTLSFQIGSALLFRRGHQEDERQRLELNIPQIDLVVVNFYPLVKVCEEKRRAGVPLEEEALVELIDIGGPTMLRAAAKNFKHVCVLSHPHQYDDFRKKWQREEIDTHQRKLWALAAFRLSSQYETALVSELAQTLAEDSERRSLRYGENPHQRAWIEREETSERTLTTSPLQGKEMSYNNILDSDSAWRALSDLSALGENKQAAAVVVKHANPCGAALAKDKLSALEMAFAGDPVSAFGSIVAVNFSVDEKVAQWLSEHFIEVLLAPAISFEAREVFKRKRNLRLLELDFITSYPLEKRSFYGGTLWQESDTLKDENWPQAEGLLSERAKALAAFGVVVCKHLKSNAIALVGEREGESFYLAGAGMGNPNRLVSVEQAVQKAQENDFSLAELILISDAFFPFVDTVEMAYQAGVKTIIQPGGSLRDEEVLKRAQELGIAMVMTGKRHFKH